MTCHWSLEAPKPARLLNLNDRVTTVQQRRDNHEVKAAWRDAIAWRLKGIRPPLRIPSKATVLIEFGTDRPNQRRDNSNFMATLKPVLDGLTIAGVWVDDDSTRVATLEPRFVTDIPKTHFRLTITWEDPDGT